MIKSWTGVNPRTRGGNGLRKKPPYLEESLSPRTRGEFMLDTHKQAAFGLSPHMRGYQHVIFSVRERDRSIPAHAGELKLQNSPFDHM